MSYFIYCLSPPLLSSHISSLCPLPISQEEAAKAGGEEVRKGCENCERKKGKEREVSQSVCLSSAATEINHSSLYRVLAIS